MHFGLYLANDVHCGINTSAHCYHYGRKSRTTTHYKLISRTTRLLGAMAIFAACSSLLTAVRANGAQTRADASSSLPSCSSVGYSGDPIVCHAALGFEFKASILHIWAVLLRNALLAKVIVTVQVFPTSEEIGGWLVTKTRACVLLEVESTVTSHSSSLDLSAATACRSSPAP